MLNWFTSVAIKAALEWLLSLLVRWKEKLEHIEQGRQEVRDAVVKKEAEQIKSIDELRNTRITDDVGLDELRKLADEHYGNKDKVSGN
jgi:DNA-binding protein H-NS